MAEETEIKKLLESEEKEQEQKEDLAEQTTAEKQASEATEVAGTAQIEEEEDITFSPSWLVITTLCLLNEIIDWVGILLNVSGVWAILVEALNVCTLILILFWRISTEGFSFTGIFGSWKNVAFMVIEHIPIIGDIFPGWLLTMFGFRKTKKKVATT